MQLASANPVTVLGVICRATCRATCRHDFA
jgi:hypothetical protein